MSTFGLVPGSGSSAWHWHLVAAELEAAGHEPIAIDLPSDDPVAGLPEYVDAAVAAVGDRTDDLVVVGHSLGSFTATWLADRLPARLLVLVAPMIPAPRETPQEWADNTGYAAATADLLDRYGRREEWNLDVQNELLLGDVPFGVRLKVPAHAKRQSRAPYATPLAIDAWPSVRTRVILAREDPLFPAEFVRALAKERLGVEAEEIDGGHTPMLSRPAELTAQILSDL